MTHLLCSDSQLSTPNISYWNLYKIAFRAKKILFQCASSKFQAAWDKYIQQHVTSPKWINMQFVTHNCFIDKKLKSNDNYNPKSFIWPDLNKGQRAATSGSKWLDNLEALTTIWNESQNSKAFLCVLKILKGFPSISLSQPQLSKP